MLPELGHYALILALCLALTQSIVPLIASYQKNILWMRLARPLVYGQTFFIGLAFYLLAVAFLTKDFSVAYVANNANSQLPWIYRFCAIWGAHEGSLLLWVFLLNIWSCAVALLSRHLPVIVIARVLSVLGTISVGFLLFLLFTSNPFTRLLPNIPKDGLDLNPLLQDPGLIAHPPMLYMGYVGFSVVFAFAIASLLDKNDTHIASEWANWCRPWTLIAWCFLTFGIILGSWWAYRELGWGGWWFWDPVENASLLPWLAGTALIHSLIVTAKRDTFSAWTVLLAIMSFSLSLLGTFLVRSGVLISVHTFASDPSRGLFMLIFLATVVGVSLSLYAFKMIRIRPKIYRFDLSARESFLLCNNMLFIGAMLTILLGTLYPLIVDALGLEKISVGPPYFNIVFFPFMGCLLFLMGIAPFSKWQKGNGIEIFKQLSAVFVLVCILAVTLPWILAELSWGVVLGLGLAFWVILATLKSLFQKTARFWTIKKLTLRQWGMVVAHIGIAICVIGVVLTSHQSIEQEVRLSMGEQVSVGDYYFKFLGTRHLTGPNYTATQAGVLVSDAKGAFIAVLEPELRTYPVQKTVLSKTAIEANLIRDLYVALGEQLDDHTWSLRIYDKPFVRWIWGGGFLVILGGLMAVLGRRR